MDTSESNEIHLGIRQKELLKTSVSALMTELMRRKMLPENYNEAAIRYEIQGTYNIGSNIRMLLEGYKKSRRDDWEVALKPAPVDLRIDGFKITCDDYDFITESLEFQVAFYLEKDQKERANIYRDLLNRLPNE
jgi:hypothetical protein